MTDYTRTAGSLQVDEIVNDDRAYCRLIVDGIFRDEISGTITFTAQVAGSTDLAVRTWKLDDKVTVSGRVTR